MKAKYGGPAYTIRTPRLVLSCWDPVYAQRLDEAVRESRESLLPWMPWAKHDVTDIRQRVDLLRQFRSSFDRDEDYTYGILDRDESCVLGGCGLHRRVGPLGFEIGYWIHAAHQRAGLATEAAAALVKAGFELFDIDRIVIRCDERNAASRRVSEKLGFRHECTLARQQKDADGEYQDLMHWVLFRSEYETSPLRTIEAEFLSATHEAMRNE